MQPCMPLAIRCFVRRRLHQPFARHQRLSIRSLSSKDELCCIAIEALTADLSSSKTSASAKQKHKKVASKAHKGASEFYNHFLDIYGAERWPLLCQALLSPPRMAALVNPFVCASTDWKQLIGAKHVRAHENQDIVVDCLEWAKPLEAYWINNGTVRMQSPSPMNEIESYQAHEESSELTDTEMSGLLDYYCLDPSSLLPVLALNVTVTEASSNKEQISVLDMCAAPGGKALSIIQALCRGQSPGMNGMVVVNEVSDPRRKRLRRVLDLYLPIGIVGSSIFVTGRNGVGFGKVQGDIQYGVKHEHFSHVLCDAPCSGERHVLQDGRALGQYKPGISKRNQKRQVALLKAAIAGCRPSGIIVYSTCSIEPEENDGVVEKILSKRHEMVELVTDFSFGIGEPTKHGWIVLPDHPSFTGLGPMYIAVLRRKRS